MTLEEAKKHCKEKSCEESQCALEHKQLAEWLMELKAYRQKYGILNNNNKEEGETLLYTANKVEERTKKKEYPKTYEECKQIMGVKLWNTLWGEDATEYEKQTEDLIDAFIRLKVCRDAYWKIAGEEMGLDKHWEPDWEGKGCYVIVNHRGDIITDIQWHANAILAFPTEEMRDAFYKNFKEEIKSCKELL